MVDIAAIYLNDSVIVKSINGWGKIRCHIAGTDEDYGFHSSKDENLAI